MRFRTRLHKRALAHTHVVSYSPTDAETLAIELARGLETGTPALPAWIEQRDLVPGQDRRDEIAETIRACDSLLFVISRESAADPDLKDDWCARSDIKAGHPDRAPHRRRYTNPARLGRLRRDDSSMHTLSSLTACVRWKYHPVIRGCGERSGGAPRTVHS